MGTRNRLAVVVWSPMVVATAAGVAWSVWAHEPAAPPVALKADRDALVARKGDYLIPRVKPAADLAAHWVPLGPAVKMDGGRLTEGLPSIEGPTLPPDPPSSPTSEPVRAEATATPHHQARVRHDGDVCATRGMRREDLYQNNHWRSWRCVR